MTYRIDIRRKATESHLLFSGVLDQAALADVMRILETLRPNVCLEFQAGTRVHHECIHKLRTLGVAQAAHSPYLAAWLGISLCQTAATTQKEQE